MSLSLNTTSLSCFGRERGPNYRMPKNKAANKFHYEQNVNKRSCPKTSRGPSQEQDKC